MIDGQPAVVDEKPSTGPDFSNLQGFQVVGARDSDSSNDTVPEDALKLEFAARATRFHNAVDASIVLANDGVIRWLGDPIAKLSGGGDFLIPGAVILADPRLPEDARQTISTRLDLWLAALSRKLLGPLFALRELQQEPQPVQDLGSSIASAFGVLDRQSKRNQIKALDQNSRACLRKHGVRFGAYYVYVPTILKPASRALALQLWQLKSPGVDAEALAQTLLPMASSGRTSLPVNNEITREGYRVAGFRVCGDRVVRVDIVERLADMIRAAFPQKAASQAQVQTPKGFVVNGQMTSLTGCSAADFASILRSLDFESFDVPRSELIVPVSEPAPATSPEPAAGNENSEVADGEPRADEPQADVNISEPPQEPDEGSALAAESAPEETDEGPAFAAERASKEPDKGPTLAAESAPESSDEGIDERPESANISGADAGEPAVSESDGALTTGESAIVTLWRPVPRVRRHEQRRRPRSETHRAPAGPSEQTGSAPGDASSGGRDCGRHRRRHEAQIGRPEAPPPDPGPSEARSRAPDGEKAERMRKNRRPDKKTQNASMGRPHHQVVNVDPSSPFAKLMELRSALVQQQAANREK